MKTKIILIFLTLIVLNINISPRYYDPDTGRFTTADTVTPGGGANSQELNRYSYCSNNPVKYVDPNGHQPAEQLTEPTENLKDKFKIIKNNPVKTNPGIFSKIFNFTTKKILPYLTLLTANDSNYPDFSDPATVAERVMNNVEQYEPFAIPEKAKKQQDEKSNKIVGYRRLLSKDFEELLSNYNCIFSRGLRYWDNMQRVGDNTLFDLLVENIKNQENTSVFPCSTSLLIPLTYDSSGLARDHYFCDEDTVTNIIIKCKYNINEIIPSIRNPNQFYAPLIIPRAKITNIKAGNIAGPND